MCITFLNFLTDLFMQIMNMRYKCRCKLGYPKMMSHRDNIYRLSRFVLTMHNSNGLIPIDLFTKLLYANSAVSKIRSQFLKFTPTKHCKRFSRFSLSRDFKLIKFNAFLLLDASGGLVSGGWTLNFVSS